MNRYINILTLFACSLFLLSCESDERLLDGQKEFKFIPQSGQTKSTQTGMFETGDRVGIFAVERTNDSEVGSLASPKYVNVQYSFNGTHFEPVGQEIRYSGKKYDFYVYSPFNASYSNIRQIIHQASATQSTQSWKEADLCTAVNTSGIDNGNVELKFSHKFATLQVKTKDDVQGVSIKNVFTTGNLDFATNKATMTGSKSDVTMLREVAGSFIATIPVQAISGTVFTIRKGNGNNVEFNLAGTKQLNEGVNVIYTIDLDATITIATAANGTATGGGKYQVGDTCTVKAIPNSGYKIEGWYVDGNKVSSSLEYKFVVSGDKTLTPKFQTVDPVVTWVYSFIVTDWQIRTGWEAGYGNVSIISEKRKHLDGVATSEAVNVGYRVSSSESWINASDNSTFLSWSQNTSISSRNGYAHWQQDESGKTDYAMVMQDGKPDDVITTKVSWEITINPTSHTFPASGGSKTFTVTLTKVTRTYTNGILTNTTSTPQSSGWTTSLTGTGFSRSGETVTATANTSTSSRTGTLTVSYQTVSASASLTQEGNIEGEIIISN